MPSFRTSTLLPLALAATTILTSTSARADESRWIAALPFGAGQFQNGDRALGVFFAVSEAAFGATSIASSVAVEVIAKTHTGRSTNLSELNGSIRAATMVNRISFASWAALAAVGIVEAQWSFGHRAHPPKRDAALTPIIAPLPGGAFVGVSSAF